jgi:hypothetical protein
VPFTVPCTTAWNGFTFTPPVVTATAPGENGPTRTPGRTCSGRPAVVGSPISSPAWLSR